eukprot:c8040_g1_i1.p1 GENE.c8040_g1_i1~~c8040_g1_i1.p1  ORF type:complete len:483 (-),score=87.15 c8040_g1_i1:36-1484(-)
MGVSFMQALEGQAVKKRNRLSITSCRNAPLTRLDVAYKALNTRFLNPKRVAPTGYSQQFFLIYSNRLKAIRPAAVAAAHKKWNSTLNQGKSANVAIVDRVLDARDNLLCIAVGTIFKQMKGKPDVLLEMSGGSFSVQQEKKRTYAGNDDVLMLEDDSGRVLLKGIVDPSSCPLITGMIVAVLGCGTPSGDFIVDDFVFPGPPPFSTTSIPPRMPASKSAPHLVFVSGLGFGHSACDEFVTSLLSDFLCGRVGSSGDHALAASVVHVVIAGSGCLCPPPRPTNAPAALSHRVRTTSSLLQGFAQLDEWIYSIVSSGLSLDLIPSSSDPTNHNLPNQPIHPSFFPCSAAIAHFRCVTNPYSFSLDGFRVTGTSGEPLQDSLRYQLAPCSPATMLSLHLQAQHLAPSAPDTIPCCPFTSTDPFVITSRPRVIFAGDCVAFESLVVGEGTEKTLVLCVPQFSKTHSAVLVNLQELTCRQIFFSGPC